MAVLRSNLGTRYGNGKSRRLTVLLLCLVLSAAQPGEVAAQQTDFRDAGQYAICMDLARNDPDSAFDTAIAWEGEGGGDAARHCAAVALIQLGYFGEAATRLERLAQGIDARNLHLRVLVLAQAGQTWWLEGEFERAFAVQTSALELSPDNPDILVERGVTLASAQNYWEAIDDFNLVLEIDPARADALVFRASAYRYVDAVELAEADIERALELDPGNPEGLLERGILRRLAGDKTGAREDWVRITSEYPDSEAAEAARLNLEKMDVTAE